MSAYEHVGETDSDNIEKSRNKSTALKVGCSVGCCLVTVVLIIFTVVAKGAGEEFVRKHLQWTTNITVCETGDGMWTKPPLFSKVLLGQQPVFNCRRGHGHMLTPANYSEVVNFACASDKFKKDIAEYNKKAAWKYVEFPSRRGKHGQDELTIAAWWLPAADPKAPRIVVQHGNNVNFNDRTVVVLAYLLRSIGFSCLVPNLRDHGVSAKSSHNSVGWGYDYHLDTLGAWDYAVNDPDNKLGGPMSKDKVGIHGFSMGGFVTSMSFGLEPEVPGAWVDSGVFEPRQVLQFSMQQSGLGFLIGFAWWFAERKAGVDLTLHTPAKALPAHATRKRPIAISQGQIDDVVPPFQSEELYKLVTSLPNLYDVREFYKPTYECGKSKHCTMHLWKPDVYRQKACDFWTHVFKLEKSYCKINKLSKYDEEPAQTV